MKYVFVTISLAFVSLLGACTTPGAPAMSATSATPFFAAKPLLLPMAARQESIPHEAILLVSLDDGTIVMQRIDSNADVCFKKNSDSSTTCLTQGAAILDPETNSVIGFEMIEERIELVAKSD